MPYYNRAIQLHNTLVSFLYHYAGRDDFEVVIVADGKNATNQVFDTELNGVIEFFRQDIPIKYSVFEKAVTNPSKLFNRAAEMAEGEVFVVTNPECFHHTNILVGFDEEFAKHYRPYVVCACMHTKEAVAKVNRYEDFKYKPSKWYQHSQHRNLCYHFCNAISRRDYFLIGGFFEEFDKGVCFDDDDFRESVKEAGLNFVTRDDLLVIHQLHKKVHTRIKGYKKLLNTNKALYERRHANG
jgi:hypothetical protein